MTMLSLLLSIKGFAQDPCGGTGYVLQSCIPCLGTGVYFGYPCGSCGGYGAVRMPCSYCANRKAYEMGRRMREIDDRNSRQQGGSGYSNGYSGGYYGGYSGGYSGGNSSSSSSSKSNQSDYGYVDCAQCYGSGKCSGCNGKGWDYSLYTQNETTCGVCNGGKKCTFCQGSGKTYKRIR